MKRWSQEEKFSGYSISSTISNVCHVARPFMDSRYRQEKEQQQERSRHQEGASREENQGSEAESKNRFLWLSIFS